MQQLLTMNNGCYNDATNIICLFDTALVVKKLYNDPLSELNDDIDVDTIDVKYKNNNYIKKNKDKKDNNERKYTASEFVRLLLSVLFIVMMILFKIYTVLNTNSY